MSRKVSGKKILMNAILSIKPEYVAEIKAGRKRFEFRKAIFKEPVGKVYIYASAPVSMVVGEFQPVDVVKGSPDDVWIAILHNTKSVTSSMTAIYT